MKFQNIGHIECLTQTSARNQELKATLKLFSGSIYPLPFITIIVYKSTLLLLLKLCLLFNYLK